MNLCTVVGLWSEREYEILTTNMKLIAGILGGRCSVLM